MGFCRELEGENLTFTTVFCIILKFVISIYYLVINIKLDILKISLSKIMTFSVLLPSTWTAP